MSDNEYSGDYGLILKSIDADALIKEVKKRPSLYNRDLKEYSDRAVKEQQWAEVCLQVVPNWCELSAEDQKFKETEVQKKWKNLKDSFQKELGLQRKAMSGQRVRKRRRYIHFDRLLFLVPYLKRKTSENHIQQDRDRSSDIPEDNSLLTDDEGDRPHKSELIMSYEPSILDVLKAQPIGEEARPNRTELVNSYETLLLDRLRAKPNDELDEDRNFALMLVPMLGKLNEEQKHYAKVEILNVMRDARLRSFSASSQAKS